MKKVFEVEYAADDNTFLFAEVCADNQKQAKEIFYRHHSKKCKIIKINFKRKWR